MSQRKPTRMLTDAFGTLVMRMAGIALTLVSTTVAARSLGPVEYGAYCTALAMAMLLAALAPLGSDRILVRNLSTTKCPMATGRETAIAHLCTTITTAVLVGGSLTAWAVNSFIFDKPEWAQTSLLATIMFVPRTLMSLRQWLAIPIIGTPRAVMPEQTILPFLFTTSLLLIVAAGGKLSAGTAAAIYSVMMVIVWIGSLQISSIRVVYRAAWKAIWDTGRSDVSRQFRNGLPFVSVGIGSVLIQSGMPIVIAAACGFEEAAYFAIAASYAGLAIIPLNAFNLSMIPCCARLYKLGEFAAAQHAVRSAATVTFSLAATLSIILWVCSPLLTTLLGTEYHMVCRLLPPLLLSILVDCLSGPTNPVMQTMKMETTHSRTLFGLVPIQFGLVYWLGSVAGIEGAAFAYLISRCLWNVIVVTRIYQLRGLVMLPYLSVRKAFSESAPVPENVTTHHRPQQCLWPTGLTPETTLSPARAA